MLESNDVKAAFEATIRHLEAERLDILRQLVPLQDRLKDVQGTQAILQKRLNPETPSRPTTLHRPPAQKYARVSVRWAILDLLNESAGMTTSEIAEALTAAGIQTRAANFANNVSAVLTTAMQKAHKEVEQLPDGKWKLTPIGVSAITYLRGTDRFQRACGLASGYVDKV